MIVRTVITRCAPNRCWSCTFARTPMSDRTSAGSVRRRSRGSWCWPITWNCIRVWRSKCVVGRIVHYISLQLCYVPPRFACETCGLAFFSKYTLKTHEKTKHQNRQVTPSKSGRQSLARTKPSMIIVMPGPPDRQVSKAPFIMRRRKNSVYHVHYFLESQDCCSCSGQSSKPRFLSRHLRQEFINNLIVNHCNCSYL